MPGAIRTLEIEEGSIRGGRYRITVKFRGKVVGEFTRNTMEGASRAFHEAGYQRVAWAEGPRIVCQEQE